MAHSLSTLTIRAIILLPMVVISALLGSKVVREMELAPSLFNHLGISALCIPVAALLYIIFAYVLLTFFTVIFQAIWGRGALIMLMTILSPSAIPKVKGEKDKS